MGKRDIISHARKCFIVFFYFSRSCNGIPYLPALSLKDTSNASNEGYHFSSPLLHKSF